MKNSYILFLAGSLLIPSLSNLQAQGVIQTYGDASRGSIVDNGTSLGAFTMTNDLSGTFDNSYLAFQGLVFTGTLPAGIQFSLPSSLFPENFLGSTQSYSSIDGMVAGGSLPLLLLYLPNTSDFTTNAQTYAISSSNSIVSMTFTLLDTNSVKFTGGISNVDYQFTVSGVIVSSNSLDSINLSAVYRAGQELATMKSTMYANAVPEPTTGRLLVGGLAMVGLGLVRYRRR